VEPFFEDEPIGWQQIADLALAEDLGFGDVTRFAVSDSSLSQFEIESQAEGILCGIGIVQDLLHPPSDSDDEFAEYRRMDGDPIQPGTLVFRGKLNSRDVLRCERVALNLLMHLSGIATLTSKYVEAIRGTRAKIVDTRKTLPGLRQLQKYAVRCGGGYNHRMSLSDGILIKDNHIIAAGGIQQAIDGVRKHAPHLLKIEVECGTVAQVDRALTYGADVILLDNMSIAEMRDAVSICAGRAVLEASGGVNLDNVRMIAETGVDYISVGALTHSAPALPFHLEFR
jgi:nicotinate-nucleotide pyrophosphorylase (carboxylating)